MPKLVNVQGNMSDVAWIELPLETTSEQKQVVVKQGDYVKCPLAVLYTQGKQIKAQGAHLALMLAGDDELDAVSNELCQFEQIHIHFPEFKDGRGYSLARMIREQYGFKGQLRATGDITQDQLFYLARCGFDAFELRDDQDLTLALTAFSSFTQTYQAASDQPLPIYRR